jgi:FlaA1/EpsC-like NDP-sugar epimerase
MGSPVRIADVAQRLVEQSEQDVRIVYSGLRPGEKLHEVLLGSGEVDVRPNHPLVSQVPVPALTFDEVRGACSVDGRLTVSSGTLALAATWGTAPAGEPAVAPVDPDATGQ